MEIEMLKKMIGIQDVAVAKEKAYISNRFYNALIEYNIQEKNIEKVERFINMDASSFAYHRGCTEHNGILYFYPDNGYGVHAYNLDSGCQKYYDLGFCRVGYAHVYGEELVLVPWYAEQGLITIDLKKETINIRQDWWNAGELLEEAGTNFLYTGVYGDNTVWSHCTQSNYLLISDFRNHSIKKYNIDAEEGSLYGSAYDGNDFWFAVNGKDIIYQWNMENGLQNCFNPGFAVDKSSCDIFPSRKIVCVREYVFIIPCNENALFLLNKETGKMELLSHFPAGTIYPKAKYWSIEEKVEKNALYLFCDTTNLIIQVDLDSLNVTYFNTQIMGDKVFEEYTEQIWKAILVEMNSKDCLYENGYDWKTYLVNYLRFNKEKQLGNAGFFQTDHIGSEIYRKAVEE